MTYRSDKIDEAIEIARQVRKTTTDPKHKERLDETLQYLDSKRSEFEADPFNVVGISNDAQFGGLFVPQPATAVAAR